MEKQLFIIMIYLLAGSYLLWQAMNCAVYIWQALLRWRLWHSPGGRLAIIDQYYGHKSNHSYALQVVGFVSGIGIALLSVQRLQPPHWLMFVFAVLGFGMERLLLYREQRTLPDAITLISIYRAASDRGYTLFDALRFAVLRLPPGPIKEAVEGVLQHQRRNMPIKKCLAPLKRCSRHLAELVACYEAGGSTQAGSINLLAVQRRARWEWEANYQTYLMIDKVQNITRPLQSFVSGGLIIALWCDTPHLYDTLAAMWGKLFV